MAISEYPTAQRKDDDASIADSHSTEWQPIRASDNAKPQAKHDNRKAKSIQFAWRLIDELSYANCQHAPHPKIK